MTSTILVQCSSVAEVMVSTAPTLQRLNSHSKLRLSFCNCLSYIVYITAVVFHTCISNLSTELKYMLLQQTANLGKEILFTSCESGLFSTVQKTTFILEEWQ